MASDHQYKQLDNCDNPAWIKSQDFFDKVVIWHCYMTGQQYRMVIGGFRTCWCYRPCYNIGISITSLFLLFVTFSGCCYHQRVTIQRLLNLHNWRCGLAG